jgi:hypothetical protein
VARVLNDMPNKSASFETLFEKLREVAPDYVRNPKVQSFATCISEARSRSSGGTPIMVVSTCAHYNHGRHYLDGQLDQNGRLIGLSIRLYNFFGVISSGGSLGFPVMRAGKLRVAKLAHQTLP